MTSLGSRRRRLAATLYAGVLLALAGGAQAQLQRPPTPGSVHDSLAAPRPTTPPSPAQIILPEQPGPSIHDRRGKRFQVHSFRFVGNTVFPVQRLKQVVERFLDLELNLYDLNVAADSVTEFYHDRGYTLARAVIPAQRVDDGVVTIAVVEGRVGKVLFSGNKGYADNFLQLNLVHLQPGSLVATDRLERTLLLLNDLPGFEVRATLAPGAEFGTSDILVKAEEKRVAMTATVDNFGRKETGENRVNLGFDLNNPFGIGDQLTLLATGTDQGLLTYGKVGYSLPLNHDGLRLAASYSDESYEVAGAFAALGLSGRSSIADISVQYPLTRSRGRNETLSLTAKSTELLQKTFGVKTSDTRVPMLNVGYLANRIGNDASVSNLWLQMSSNFRRNTDGSRQNAVRFRLEVDGNYLLPLDRHWDIFLRAAFVHSPDRLPDSEKYSIGGPGSVRSYISSELRGDSGAQVTLEFRRSLKLASMPGSIAIFGDAGRVVYKAPGYSNAWQSMTGWGAGLTLYPTSKVTLKLEGAVPGSGQSRGSDGKSSRLWASINASF